MGCTSKRLCYICRKVFFNPTKTLVGRPLSDKGLARYLKALQQNYFLVALSPFSTDMFMIPGKLDGRALTLGLLAFLFCSRETFTTSMFFAFIFLLRLLKKV